MAARSDSLIQDKNDVATFVLHGWCALLLGALLARWLGARIETAEYEPHAILLVILFAPTLACWYYGLLVACVLQGLKALRPGTAKWGRAAAAVLNLVVVVWGFSWFL